MRSSGQPDVRSQPAPHPSIKPSVTSSWSHGNFRHTNFRPCHIDDPSHVIISTTLTSNTWTPPIAWKHKYSISINNLADSLEIYYFSSC